MTRPYYGEDSIPDYYTQDDLPRQRPSGHTPSRIPRPGYGHPPPHPDRQRPPPQHSRPHPQPHMRPDHCRSPHGPSPRRAPEPHYYPEHQSAWDASQHLYDGTGYEDDYEQYDQWPLPAHQPAPSPRQNQSPRRPPPRPQRPDESPSRMQYLEYQQGIRDPSRMQQHSQSPSRPYHAPPPPPQHAFSPQSHHGSPSSSHHGSGQWHGDGYTFTPPHYPPPRRPLPPPGGRDSPNSSQSSIPQYVEPQMPQQAALGQNNRRPPLGPPPSARRAPVQYAQVGPVHPIVEETDSMRSSLRNPSVHTGGHDSKTSFASSNAIPIGIPQVYLDGNNSTREHLPASSEVDEDEYVEEATGRRLEQFAGPPSRDRDQPSPEVLVRQASLGKKSRPTLTTVKSGDKMKRTASSGDKGIGSLPSQQHARQASQEAQPYPAQTELSRAVAQEQLEGQATAGAHTSEESVIDPHIHRLSSVPASRTRTPNGDGAGSRTPEEVLRSGTGLLDASSSSESEREVKRKRSRELLGAAIANELHPRRSTARSPLAPRDDEKVKSILDSLEKGGAISAEEAEELKRPTGGLSERPGKRRPARLDVDAVRDAEARGSLTSLPDLIRRATKLASNLDRGKTASRLDMNWFDGVDDGKKRRSNNVNDMLNAFPPAGNPNARGSRLSLTNWSSRLRHSALPSDSDAGELEKRKRRCCGMPLWLFLLLLLVLTLLIAAAVVVPVMLLVVVPNQNDNSASQVGSCQKKLNCQNGGANILGSDGNCECLCVNGYTGSTCSQYSEQGCTSASIGSTRNATVGEAIPRLLGDASNNFSIPLDGQQLLGLFSQSDLTCSSQNALVTFNSQSSKRSLIGARIPTPTLGERADSTATSPTMTSNGIVYASGSPSAVASTPDNSTLLDFARVGVLYVFQDSGTLSVAAAAQESLQSFFSTGLTSTGQTMNAQNISLSSGFSCNLTGMTLTTSNGITIGGARGGNSTSAS